LAGRSLERALRAALVARSGRPAARKSAVPMPFRTRCQPRVKLHDPLVPTARTSLVETGVRWEP